MAKLAKDLTPSEWREELNNRANTILNELMAARELAQSLGKDPMLIQPPYLDALLRLVEEFAELVRDPSEQFMQGSRPLSRQP